MTTLTTRAIREVRRIVREFERWLRDVLDDIFRDPPAPGGDVRLGIGA